MAPVIASISVRRPPSTSWSMLARFSRVLRAIFKASSDASRSEISKPSARATAAASSHKAVVAAASIGMLARYPLRRRVRAARGLIPAFTTALSQRARRLSEAIQARHGRHDLGSGDEGRLTGDPQARAANRVRVFLPAHEGDAVPA